MEYYCLSDVGLIRENNQDSYMAIKNSYGDFLAFVCDGIGGGNAGDVASGEVVKYFSEVFPSSKHFTSLDDAKEYLLGHLVLANRNVFELSRRYKEFEGMGTTLTGIMITEFGTLSINVGDSRVYGFVDEKSFRLTVDHTLVNQMLQNGEITFEESLTHPKRHYLVRAVGVWPEVEFDIHKVRDMDYYLLCSDGLCGYVNEDEVLKIVYGSYVSIKEKCEALVAAALLKGGNDNITVVLVKK